VEVCEVMTISADRPDTFEHAPGIDVSPLFEPFELGRLVLRNRFVMPGMQRGWVEGERPLPRMADYYRRRVEGGVSLVISEACAIDHDVSTGQAAAAFIDDSTAGAWATCVDAVHAAGGHMLIQLWHEGAMRKEGVGGRRPDLPTLSPSGLVYEGRENGVAATAEDLEEIKAAFVRSALAAREAGADGIEVHGAHGFLIDEFLWAETNRRTDGYGGPDLRARLRFPTEVVAAIRNAIGPDPVISFRFSQWKEVDYEARICETPEELGTMLQTLRSAGVDMFHASARYFSRPAWSGSDLGLAGWCKSLTDAAVVTVGSVGLNVDIMTSILGEEETRLDLEPTLGELVRRFGRGEFDLVAVGRSNISDPEWVRKIRDGRHSEVRAFSKDDIRETESWDAEFAEEANRDHNT
jgi:2,4-dienoyl-CoA reductase-like NADH-dependent reductase (Old Yellow Enzyme family)